MQRKSGVGPFWANGSGIVARPDSTAPSSCSVEVLGERFGTECYKPTMYSMVHSSASQTGVSASPFPRRSSRRIWLICGVFVFNVNPIYAQNTKNPTTRRGEGLGTSATRLFAPIDASLKQRGPKRTSRGSSDLPSSSANGSPRIERRTLLITESRVRGLWGDLLFCFSVLFFYFLFSL